MEVRPFRALRYDTRRVNLADVLTQPYDKITPEMQEGYYGRHAHNLVRFELAKREPGEAPEHYYRRAADFLDELRRAGALTLDHTPSFYAYAQRFRHPATGERLERTGIIALGRLYDYEDGMVFRHEQTLSAPKADRMALLRATRIHSGQIFMLYEDAERRAEAVVEAAIGGRVADCAVPDEYGGENLLWRISDTESIAALVETFADKKLIIADGHHRYETARAYRDEQRRTGAAGEGAHDFVMMTLINMASPGLVVLPTHRVVLGVGLQDWPALLKEWFTVQGVTLGDAPTRALHQQHGTAFIMATAEGAYLLRGIEERIARALPSLSAAERKVDVLVLHKLVLERALSLTEEDIREQRNVRYFRDPEKALEQLWHGADAVFLVNPIPLSVLRDVCYGGKVLPQKSTDFYPKLLSGLTLYDLDRSFAPGEAALLHHSLPQT